MSIIKMKRVLSVIMVLALVLGAAVSVYAQELTSVEEERDSVAVVKGQYNGEKPGDVFSIDIEWGALSCTYTQEGTPTWNPSNHEYTFSSSTAQWSYDGNEFNITNHSNCGLDLEFEFEKNNNIDGTYDGVLLYSTGSLAAARLGLVAFAPKFTNSITFNGNLSPAYAGISSVDLGNIVIKITKKA